MKAVCVLVLLGTAAIAQTTVPMILEGNAPIVELRFDTPSGGVRSARFVVDSGGGAFILGAKLTADIGAKRQGPVSSEDGSQFQAVTEVRARVNEMELDLKGIPTSGLVGQDQLLSRNNAEGMIPGRLLQRYRMVFDYPGRTLTFGKPDKAEGRGAKLTAGIRPNNGFPRIEIQVGDATYGVLLDTGASFTMISRPVLEEWSKANANWPSAIGAFGFANMSGGKMEAEAMMLRVPEIKFGSIPVLGGAAVSRPEGTFEKSMSRMMTAPIIGAVAGNVLREFRVDIDYQNGFVYLEKGKDVTSAETGGVGLVLGPGKNGLMVIAIASSAVPDVKASVHAGDELVAVDQVEMMGKPLAIAAEALQGSPGSRRKLTILRNGERVVVTVSCAKLL
jgi:predicted aspartyl protease